MTAELESILYIDDDKDILFITKMTLERLGGYEVRTCNSGAEGIGALDTFSPDLILLDMMMPELDGAATMELIKKKPNFTDTPFVFLTAKAHPKEIAALRSKGAIDIITKPYDPSTISGDLKDIWLKSMNTLNRKE